MKPTVGYWSSPQLNLEAGCGNCCFL